MSLMIRFVLLGMCCLCTIVASGQFGYGFRAGLTNSKFIAETETDDSGNQLDRYKFSGGFHIGMSVNYAFTDLFGVRGELIFTQRGSQHIYSGDSYYVLARWTPQQRMISGRREQEVNLNMATFEIPVILYYKIGSFEISAGINTALILSTSGGGRMTFTGTAPSGNMIEPFRVILQYNYNKDHAQGAGPANMFVNVDGTNVLIPGTTGAYYDFAEKDGNKYNALDLGITGGLAFYLNEGLYIGGRITYGLQDAADSQYNVSLYRLGPGNTNILRDFTTQHLSINASIGFLF